MMGKTIYGVMPRLIDKSELQEEIMDRLLMTMDEILITPYDKQQRLYALMTNLPHYNPHIVKK